MAPASDPPAAPTSLTQGWGEKPPSRETNATQITSGLPKATTPDSGPSALSPTRPPQAARNPNTPSDHTAIASSVRQSLCATLAQKKAARASQVLNLSLQALFTLRMFTIAGPTMLASAPRWPPTLTQLPLRRPSAVQVWVATRDDVVRKLAHNCWTKTLSNKCGLAVGKGTTKV